MDPLSAQLLARIDADRERLVAFYREILRAPSPNPPGDTRPVAEIILRALKSAGLDPLVIAPNETMPNIIARFDGGRAGRRLVLNGHMDCFPVAAEEWTHDPWGAELEDGRVYGRGACDMKGGLAALTLSFLYLHEVRDRLAGGITYTAVSDEETFGPWGARYLFERHRDLMLGDCLLSGEPSSPLCVRFGEKSPIWIAITVRTPGGHGAYVHSSASATKIAGAIVADLEKVTEIEPRPPDNLMGIFRDPAIAAQIDRGCGAGHAAIISKVTLSIGRLAGGLKVNMLPGECRIEADIRLPVGLERDAMRPVVERILARYPEASWEEISPPEDQPNWSDPDGEMMEILRATVRRLKGFEPVPVITLGATDTRLWRYAGIPAYVYGCSPETMASADENVLVEDYLHVLRTQTLAARRYLSDGI